MKSNYYVYQEGKNIIFKSIVFWVDIRNNLLVCIEHNVNGKPINALLSDQTLDYRIELALQRNCKRVEDPNEIKRLDKKRLLMGII